MVYAADSFAGSLLEILAHVSRPRRLPGAHHCVRLEIPDDLIERLDEQRLPDWYGRTSQARALGDRWLAQGRSVGLLVPALPSRPAGRLVLINPAHPAADRVHRAPPFVVSWDERLF